MKSQYSFYLFFPGDENVELLSVSQSFVISPLGTLFSSALYFFNWVVFSMSSYFISPLSGIIGKDLFPFCNLLLHLNDGVKKSFLISRRVPEMTSKIDFDSFLKTKAVPLTLSNIHTVTRFNVRLFSAPPSPHFTEMLKKIVGLPALKGLRVTYKSRKH